MEEIKFEDILVKFKEEYASLIRDTGHNSSGKLASSMRWKTQINGSFYLITIILPDYATYLEDGRKPGKFPPIEEIKKWIKIKPVLPQPLKNGKLPTTSQLAFLIARKISLKGTKGTGLIKRTMDSFGLISKLKDRLSESIKGEIEATVKRELVERK